MPAQTAQDVAGSGKAAPAPNGGANGAAHGMPDQQGPTTRPQLEAALTYHLRIGCGCDDRRIAADHTKTALRLWQQLLALRSPSTG